MDITNCIASRISILQSLKMIRMHTDISASFVQSGSICLLGMHALSSSSTFSRLRSNQKQLHENADSSIAFPNIFFRQAREDAEIRGKSQSLIRVICAHINTPKLMVNVLLFTHHRYFYKSPSIGLPQLVSSACHSLHDSDLPYATAGRHRVLPFRAAGHLCAN